MRINNVGLLFGLLFGLWCGCYPVMALAYVNPGAGLTFLGSLIGFVLALLFVVVGLFLWPIRWFLQRRKQRAGATDQDAGIGSNNSALHENPSNDPATHHGAADSDDTRPSL